MIKQDGGLGFTVVTMAFVPKYPRNRVTFPTQHVFRKDYSTTSYSNMSYVIVFGAADSYLLSLIQTRPVFNNVKHKDRYFVFDQVQFRTGLGCVRPIIGDFLKSLITLSILTSLMTWDTSLTLRGRY